VQVQTEACTARQVGFESLMLEIRGFLGALAESHRSEQHRNGQQTKRVIHKDPPCELYAGIGLKVPTFLHETTPLNQDNSTRRAVDKSLSLTMSAVSNAF
jgi:hypothetical protein